MTHDAKRLGWVICANISDHLRSGREKGRFYQGTRKFSGGTKVYLGEPFWGMGGMNLRVAGLHRISRSWTHSVISSGVLVNLRPYAVYSVRKWETLGDNFAVTFDTKDDALEFMERVHQAVRDEWPTKIKPVVAEGPWGYFQTDPYHPAAAHPVGETSLINRAAQYAKAAHQGQTLWRGTQNPYFNYLKQTVDIVKKIELDPSILAAAWLHGTHARTDRDATELEVQFGGRVAALVRELTYTHDPDGQPSMQAQYAAAPSKSDAAALIEAATLVVTTREMRIDPPNWPIDGTRAYLNNAAKIMARLTPRRALHQMLEEEALATGRHWKAIPPPLPD
ncbi:HD domain-containing protein [uncultured Sulfitobacter sp.]|uniref:HD domain-containing protein n=1 Tax=uncultured Sulfitobacter sp. TaxID=191468 RepID=UPI002626BE50|nr:HD domain-containing protein [uncultured Sulfitobacter sp.]